MVENTIKLRDGNLYIGWSNVSITPDKPVNLQGQFYERISQFVQSPITVTVLALETRDSQNQVIDQVMTGSCDLCVVFEDVLTDLRKRLKDKLPGFDLQKLFINATHIHTGPSTQDLTITSLIDRYVPPDMLPPKTADKPGIMQDYEYREFLLERLSLAFIEAWQNRTRGFVSQELAFAVLSHNRRVVYDDGSALMYGSTDTVNYFEPEGPEDHGVEMMYFWDANEQLTGILVNAASPAQVVEGKYFISADYWGEARKELARRYPGKLYLLPQCSAAGDQSPRDMVRRGRGEPNMHEIEGAVELGRRVVEAIFDKLDAAAKHKSDHLILAHQTIRLNLPLRTVSRTEAERAKEKFNQILAQKKTGEYIEVHERGNLYPQIGYLDRYETQQKKSFYSPEIHILRIGDAAMATSPFELFIQYGLQIKARSKAKQTFLVQLACDCGMYLPTQKAIEGGHYSAFVASGIVGPEGGKYLVNCSIEAINRLWVDEE
ncbi:MAG: hypothetical protein VB070_09295 [Clostridiaceae bacterium]|nr:hypothetical protein [Clostridiaceae bacterium]